VLGIFALELKSKGIRILRIFLIETDRFSWRKNYLRHEPGRSVFLYNLGTLLAPGLDWCAVPKFIRLVAHGARRHAEQISENQADPLNPYPLCSF
jgi:hypothetical protein